MPKKILVVDDSSVVRAAVRFALEHAGLEVVEAVDGKAGLAQLDALSRTGERPAVILTDVNMPVMDGITFIKEVKATALKFIPILVLTTESQEARKLEGKAAGASGWLVKPFRNDQLVAVVRRFVPEA